MSTHKLFFFFVVSFWSHQKKKRKKFFDSLLKSFLSLVTSVRALPFVGLQLSCCIIISSAYECDVGLPTYQVYRIGSLMVNWRSLVITAKRWHVKIYSTFFFFLLKTWTNPIARMWCVSQHSSWLTIPCHTLSVLLPAVVWGFLFVCLSFGYVKALLAVCLNPPWFVS